MVIPLPTSPKAATAKGRTGLPGDADQPGLTGPTARPSEVIQEARHCFAQNKDETMSNNIPVLVKVNSVWGIVFSMTSLGTGLVICLGFSVCGQGPPLPCSDGNMPPHESSGLPSETLPPPLTAPCVAHAQPSTYRSVGFSPSLTQPPPSQVRRRRLRAGEGLGQVTQPGAVGQDSHLDPDSMPLVPPWHPGHQGDLWAGTYQSSANFLVCGLERKKWLKVNRLCKELASGTVLGGEDVGPMDSHPVLPLTKSSAGKRSRD